MEELQSHIINSKTVQRKTNWKMITAKGSIFHPKINPKKKCSGTDRQIKEGRSPIWSHMTSLTGVYDTERTGIQPIHKNLTGTIGSWTTPKQVVKIEVTKNKRVTVYLKIICDIARTEVHINDVKMGGTHRDLDTHNFITRRGRKIWKTGRGKRVIYSY